MGEGRILLAQNEIGEIGFGFTVSDEMEADGEGS